MKNVEEFKFQIEAFSPSTIPMLRLAEYMADLAILFGCTSSVHFLRLEEGSTIIVPAVDFEDIPKVNERLESVRIHEAPTDAMKAFADLDRKLAKDNASGTLINGSGCKIIQFPGRDRPKPLIYGPVKQQGSLDGVLIRIGGKDETVPVSLMNEDIAYTCNVSRSLARELAPHLFGAVLRVYGNGKWYRDEEKGWIMEKFNITGFEILKDLPLTEVVSRLRSIEGSEWKQIDDPLAELYRIRHGSEEVH